jgi:hypothetical protein
VNNAENAANTIAATKLARMPSLPFVVEVFRFDAFLFVDCTPRGAYSGECGLAIALTPAAAACPD